VCLRAMFELAALAAAAATSADSTATGRAVSASRCRMLCVGPTARFEFEPPAKVPPVPPVPLAAVLGAWPAPDSHVLILSCVDLSFPPATAGMLDWIDALRCLLPPVMRCT
jgi:hypothetical protein